MQILTVLLRHFLSLFIGQGFNVGLPPRAPADMPLPYSTQDRSGVFVVPCSETAFFTTTHFFISNFDGFAKSHQSRHPGESRGPELPVFPGFRLPVFTGTSFIQPE